MSVRIRFILTGACPPSYSGKQVQLNFPLEDENGAPTTTAHLKQLIRTQWPENMSEMKEVVEKTEMRVLKTGNLLSDDTQIRSVLTATELSECSINPSAEGSGRADEDQKSVLMHLVFQSNQSQGRQRDGSAGGGRRDNASHDSGCCTML
ncbi:DUF2407 ubiquitin-like domain containing protein, putative [Trypanosoma equiperdum]|uniref:UBL3-like ubiquitin domain-containing protein n=3 Tax=Trypanozoon TaxID=39700 RepID=Q38CJ9_TRYB2|nr:hypothetical protein, conserved [Trypanosoma brucei brucei TREU927]EAN77471.1 hypothetical protein, conserved [Trypanosoma brucei brucei TREU927]RHW69418.1 DUF2407 ubiquitin-like domain containing protein [Trypanosoma brucei equiperdum]SCU72072.1 DUF2407 ubiquitin-like domain containing protein, putative [Trypanosoma equiperdum]